MRGHRRPAVLAPIPRGHGEPLSCTQQPQDILSPSLQGRGVVVGGVQGVWQGVPHPQQLRGQGVAQVGAIPGWHPADTAPWKGWGPMGHCQASQAPSPAGVQVHFLALQLWLGNANHHADCAAMVRQSVPPPEGGLQCPLEHPRDGSAISTPVLRGGGGGQGQSKGALLLLSHFRGGGIVPEAKPQPLCRGLKFHC